MPLSGHGWLNTHIGSEIQCGLEGPCFIMFSQNTKHCEGEQCDRVLLRKLYFTVRIPLIDKSNKCRRICLGDVFICVKKWKIAKFHSARRHTAHSVRTTGRHLLCKQQGVFYIMDCEQYQIHFFRLSAHQQSDNNWMHESHGYLFLSTLGIQMENICHSRPHSYILSMFQSYIKINMVHVQKGQWLGLKKNEIAVINTTLLETSKKVQITYSQPRQ